jgi:hypothetical protein
MALYGVEFVCQYTAWDTSANSGKTGDQGNHTLYWVKDGTASAATNAAAQVDATNCPGTYKVTITATEAQCIFGTLAGKSATANVVIIPTHIAFERLPNVAPGAQNGLPILDANGRISADATAISGDSGAADNLEAACDGGTYNVGGGGVVAASVTGAVGSVTGAVGSVTGNVGGDVAGKVLGGGAGTMLAAGVRAVDGSGNAVATAASIAALNDLDATEAQTAAAAALTAYDPPTAAELTSGLAGLNDLSSVEAQAAAAAAITASSLDEAATRTLLALPAVAPAANGGLPTSNSANQVRALDGSGNAIAPASTALSNATFTDARAGYLDKLNLGSDTVATAANQTTILNRLGAWTGTGINTILGAFKALLSKAASAPSDIGGTFDPATDSVEAIRDTEPMGTAMRGTDSAALAATALSNLVWTDTKAGYLTGAVALEATLTAIKGAGWSTETLAAIDALIDAIKAKTDLIPASPAAVGSAMALTSGERSTLADAILDEEVNSATATGNTLRAAAKAAWAQGFGRWVLSGTTLTLYGTDGVTAVRTFTLNDAENPTSRTPA